MTLRPLLALALFPAGAGLAAGTTPRYPFPQHAVYAPGTIRPSHRAQAQQDDDVRAYYDRWKASFLVPAGTAAAGSPLYRVTFGAAAPDRTVSEGQGYGMMIVAFMAGHDPDAQLLFDGLWRFARAHPSRIDSRLMAFQVPETPGNDDSAFDGDCDIAYALLLADRQWSGAGPIDYGQEAARVIAGMLESTIGPDSRLPMLGDWIVQNDPIYNQYTPRSSDFILDHFRAFGRATGNPVWTDVVAASQTVISSLQANYSPATGLLPDFIVPASRTDHAPMPAPPDFLEGPNDGAYYYNALRDPWRIGTDALLSGDPFSLAQTRAIANWAPAATGGNPANINRGYALDGSRLPPQGFSIAFAAPLGVAAMTVSSRQQWLNDVYDAVRGSHEDYYEDTVTLLSLLVMTGNYWDPTSAP